MSEFGPTNSFPSSKHRKLDDRGLPSNVSTDLLGNVLSLESSHIGSSKDESGEDSSDAESSESSFEVGLSGTTSVSGDSDSSPSEGPDCPFILLDEWEVNNHCSSLSKKRLLKIQSKFQIPYNVTTWLAKV